MECIKCDRTTHPGELMLVTKWVTKQWGGGLSHFPVQIAVQGVCPPCQKGLGGVKSRGTYLVGAASLAPVKLKALILDKLTNTFTGPSTLALSCGLKLDDCFMEMLYSLKDDGEVEGDRGRDGDGRYSWRLAQS